MDKNEKLKELLALAKQNKAEQQIRKYFNLPDHNLNRDEFLKGYKEIISQVKNLETKLIERIGNKATIEKEELDMVKSSVVDDISKLKIELISLFNKSFKEQENGMNFIRDKVRRIKEGVNGKDGRDGADGTDGADGKEGVDGIVDDTIVKKAIKKLKKEIEELRKMKVIYTGGGSSLGGHIVKTYDLSSQLNGVLKTFSLPSFWRVIDIKLSSVPVMRLTTDYTVDTSNHQISFTSEIKASTDLSTGQSCLVIYSE